MSRIATILLLALVSVLLVSQVCHAGYSMYDDEDQVGSGATPSTSTLSCTKNAAGEEVCESLAKTGVPDEAELAERVANAEAERAAAAEAKRAARAAKDAAFQAEREAKMAKRRAEQDAKAQEQALKDQERGQKDIMDRSKLPQGVKKLQMSYYKFFGVEEDTPKLKIRKVANQMALENHPDKCPDRDDQKCIETRKQKMEVINQARQVLLDDDLREKYDFLRRFGFKVYDEELYKDTKERFDNGEEIHGDWGGVSHPGSDYSSMNVSESGAGWLLLITGLLTAGMVAWPVIKFWEKSVDGGKKKEQSKKGLQEALRAKQAAADASASLKKKQEKFTGEKAPKKNETVAAAPTQSPKSGKKQ